MTKITKASLAYLIGNTMYINVTNLCTNNCVFCIRNIENAIADANLWLESENITAQDIICELKEKSPEKRDEIVFCGYGEPLIKLDIVKEVAKFIKDNYPDVPVRVNTNGHANLIHKRNVVPVLAGLIDSVSVSLNAENAELYGKISGCTYNSELAFDAVKEFIGSCAKNGIDTTATIVTGFEDYIVDVDKCRVITESLGAKFRVREWLDSGYN